MMSTRLLVQDILKGPFRGCCLRLFGWGEVSNRKTKETRKIQRRNLEIKDDNKLRHECVTCFSSMGLPECAMTRPVRTQQE